MMKNLNWKTWILGGAFFLTLLLISTDAAAQCAMCKGAAQTGLDPERAGRSLNLGILLLFGMPYLLVGGIAYIWWRNKKSAQEADAEVEIESALRGDA